MMTHVSKWLIPALCAFFVPAVSTVTMAGHTANTANAANAVTKTPDSIRTDDAEEELEWLQDEYANAYSAWLGKLKAAEDDGARAALQGAHPTYEFAPLFVVFAGEHPRTEYAWQALTWVASQVREGEHLEAAVGILARDHVADERLAEVCSSLRNSPDAGVSRGLRAIAEKSPNRDVQGTASFTLGVQLKARAAQARAGSKAAAGLLEEFERLMQSVQANFADVEMFGSPLGTWATGELFEHQNLQIGMLAPDIEAEDVDGVSFKLSDYRGKVVMLDFWGHW